MSSDRGTLMSMLFGYFPPQVLHVAVRLGLADQPSQEDLFSVSYSDLNMLVCTSGRERTAREFGDLLAAAGFAVRRIVPCPPTGYSIIEAQPA
jgi:hypothetical protein